MAIGEREVLEALKAVEDPDLGRDIVTLKFVKDVEIKGERVAFTVQLTTPACPVRDRLEEEARRAVGNLPGVSWPRYAPRPANRAAGKTLFTTGKPDLPPGFPARFIRVADLILCMRGSLLRAPLHLH